MKHRPATNGGRAERRLANDEAVSAVIGTILIMGIVVMGTAVALFWGAPELEKLQQQGAMTAMTGEFQQIRAEILRLDLTDQANVPGIQVNRGTLALEQGTRIQITAMFDAGDADCDMHVDDWGVATATDTITVTIDDCGTADNIYIDDDGVACSAAPCFRVYGVTGDNLVPYDLSTISTGAQSTTAGPTFTISASRIINTVVTPADFSDGSWLFQLGDTAGTTATAQAWLLDGNALQWVDKGQQEFRLQLEAGALFSRQDDSFFLEESPRILEESTTAGEYVMDLSTLVGEATSITGQSSPSLYLGLLGQHVRVSEETVWGLRFDFEGTYAEAWCNTIDRRDLDTGLVASTYLQAAGYGCTDGGTDGRRSVLYTYDPDLDLVPDSFPFEFIHERVTAVL